MLSTLLALAVNKGLNAALRLDPLAQHEMQSLAGKSLGMRIAGLGLELRIAALEDGQVDVAGAGADAADVMITGLPFSLMRMGLEPENQDALFAGGVQLHGSIELAKRFSSVLQRLDPDWEELLAPYCGDVVAQKLGNSLRMGHRWRNQMRVQLMSDSSEYLREEARHLPHAIELDDWMSAVDRLRADVDRLELRVRRMKQHVEGDA